MKRGNEGPLPALIASAVVVCVIATVLGFWQIWIPTIIAFIVVANVCQPPRR